MVVAIIVIVVGLFGVQLVRGPGDLVRDESEQLARLLKAAREEAILQGRVYALGSERDSYWFLRLERDGKLKVLRDDELLRTRRLPRRHGHRKARRSTGRGRAMASAKAWCSCRAASCRRFAWCSLPAGRAWSVVGAPDGAIRAQAGS